MPKIATDIQNKGFIFDQNKCVGCQACVLACQIENKTELPYNWRNVHPSNAFNQSQIPLFYLSIACNHCEEAPCMNGCPTNAYHRDTQTNAILIDERKCIGCSYCVWVCPYDAPKMQNGIIQKCTFCEHKLRTNEKPACAMNCPLGALDYGNISSEKNRIPGFSEIGIKPNIQIIPLLEKKKIPEMDFDAVKPEEKEEISISHAIVEKIKLNEEWPIAIFTFITALLVGYYCSTFISNVNIIPIPFFSLALLAGGLSLFHLRKPIKAISSIFNLKSSWLSREILSYALFLCLAAIAQFVSLKNNWINILALISGILCLISIDQLYKQLVNIKKIVFHTGETLYIALFIFVILSPSYMLFMVLVKNIAYLSRKLSRLKSMSGTEQTITITKITFALLIPSIAWFIYPAISIISLIISELIDRMEFYLDLKLISPEKQISITIRNFPEVQK